MARITVEDCVKQVENRFELALLAAERARQLAAEWREAGRAKAEPRAVTALRDIAAATVDPEALRAEIIGRLQQVAADPRAQDRPEEDDAYARNLVRSIQQSAPTAANQDADGLSAAA